MRWLVIGSVHTLSVGQHMLLMQVVPFGQQV